MIHKHAFVDDQVLANDFSTGQIVRKPGYRGMLLSPYVGRVIYSNIETGIVLVQWPWGAEQEHASELVVDKSGDYAPSNYNSVSETYEAVQCADDEATTTEDDKWRKSLSSSRVVDAYESKTISMYRTACQAMHYGFDSMSTYNYLTSVYAGDHGYDVVRRTVSNLYLAAQKLAIYWKDSNRRYKVTQNEKNSGVLKCPRCASPLKPRVYRQGRRVLACKSCGFAIHPKDIK